MALRNMEQKEKMDAGLGKKEGSCLLAAPSPTQSVSKSKIPDSDFL